MAPNAKMNDGLIDVLLVRVQHFAQIYRFGLVKRLTLPTYSSKCTMEHT